MEELYEALRDHGLDILEVGANVSKNPGNPKNNGETTETKNTRPLLL